MSPNTAVFFFENVDRTILGFFLKKTYHTHNNIFVAMFSHDRFFMLVCVVLPATQVLASTVAQAVSALCFSTLKNLSQNKFGVAFHVRKLP